MQPTSEHNCIFCLSAKLVHEVLTQNQYDWVWNKINNRWFWSGPFPIFRRCWSLKNTFNYADWVTCEVNNQLDQIICGNSDEIKKAMKSYTSAKSKVPMRSRLWSACRPLCTPACLRGGILTLPGDVSPLTTHTQRNRFFIFFLIWEGWLESTASNDSREEKHQNLVQADHAEASAWVNGFARRWRLRIPRQCHQY